MIAGYVLTPEELETELLNQGFEPTRDRTATGRMWKCRRTGKHLQVPDPYEGMYPAYILRGLNERLEAMGRPAIH